MPTSPLENEFLAKLPKLDYDRLRLLLQAVILKKGQVLYAQGSSPDMIYFPVSTVVSFFVELSDGYSIEAIAFGRESIVGAAIPTIGSVGTMRIREEGIAYKISAVNFNESLLKILSISQAANQFYVSIIEIMMRNIACVSHHRLSQQLIRWILHTVDYSQSTTILFSHAELGMMLGVRREAISLALNELYLLDAVLLKRNHVEVLDRLLLEKMVCECYRQAYVPSNLHYVSQRVCQ
jgi:CRP-like cAMP-binding protein